VGIIYIKTVNIKYTVIYLITRLFLSSYFYNLYYFSQSMKVSTQIANIQPLKNNTKKQYTLSMRIVKTHTHMCRTFYY